MPGVTVTVSNEATGLSRTNVTGNEGRFVVAGLPPGTYDVRAEIAGFKPYRRPLTVAVADNVAVAIVLEVGGTAETVTVVDRPPVVNTSSSELSYLVSSQTIETLPLNGRNYTDLALLQPGVLAYPHRDGGSVVAHGLGISVNGQDPRANVYLLDGTLQNDFTNGPAGSAAGTALGMETVREFRVETNAYGAEFGRIAGGQINVLTKSGSNRYTGSAYEYLRNDALDAANYFDTLGKPDFTRNQFGGTVGGPLVKNRLFFFGGIEALVERLGKTISTVVPDDNARLGILPSGVVGVNPAVAPYLAEYPRANGPSLGQGLAVYDFPFDQRLDEQYVQGRIDYNNGGTRQMFARYTFDNTNQFLPTDYPQFPRQFLSRNQFFTGEYNETLSPNTFNSARLSFSRTRIGQNVEANTSQPLGAIRSGPGADGRHRHRRPEALRSAELWQPASRAERVQFPGRPLVLFAREALREGRRAGRALPGQHGQSDLQPGYLLVPEPERVPAQRAEQLRRPDAGGAIRSLLALHALRLLRAGRVPRDAAADAQRWSALRVHHDAGGHLRARFIAAGSYPRRSQPSGRCTRIRRTRTFRLALGAAWDVFGDGKTAVRGGYGLYFNTTNQQNLIVTVTNPPATPRPVIVNPTFPTPDFNRAGAISMRPVQFDLDNPRIHVFNVNVQRELSFHTALTVGYAGSRGEHLLRSGDVNLALPVTLPDGTLFIPAGTPRQNTAFSTIELKSSDGESWYNALIVDVRRRLAAGFAFQSSYTFSSSEDTTQASTFFSDATNGTTSAMPEFIPGYNRGPSDFNTRHNWVSSFSWELPFANDTSGLTRTLADGWQVSGIWTMRSGQPLTVFVTANRSRSQWNPSRGPGIGQDRPSYAPGYGPDNAVNGTPEQWFNPAAFVLQPAGTFGDTGRGDFTGPDLRTLDLAFSKNSRWGALGSNGRLEFRLEVFNVLNRANFGIPELRAFAGQADGEAPLATFGRITNTITSARQTQVSVRVVF